MTFYYSFLFIIEKHFSSILTYFVHILHLFNVLPDPLPLHTHSTLNSLSENKEKTYTNQNPKQYPQRIKNQQNTKSTQMVTK